MSIHVPGKPGVAEAVVVFLIQPSNAGPHAQYRGFEPRSHGGVFTLQRLDPHLRFAGGTHVSTPSGVT